MNTGEISVLIVDDEPEARELLRFLLSQVAHVKVIGEAENAGEAFRQVLKLKPDLLFLDIQMPGKDAFDLVGELRSQGFDMGYIFVTAYDEYAIQAIRTSVFDYLLKPVNPEELNQAIARYRQIRQEEKLDEITDELLAQLGKGLRLKLNTRKGFLLIDPREILCCLADGNYTRIILFNGKSETVSSNLGKIAAKLNESSFFRISRSAIINLQYLTYVDHKKGTCRLQGADFSIDLKVARNRLTRLDEFFG
ncbi:MAG: LytTR family DNA-binding domain-containing protein [Bacteroidales bacterium]